jgi:hypothetical protein
MEIIILYLFVGVVMSVTANHLTKIDEPENALTKWEMIGFTIIWPVIFIIGLKIISDEVQETNNHLRDIKKILKNNEVTNAEAPEFTSRKIED